MSPSSTDVVPVPRVVRIPRTLPRPPRAIQRVFGRAPLLLGAVCLAAVVAAFAWLFLLLQDSDRDVAAQGQAIGGLAGDVTALRSAFAGLGGNPDEVAPEPSARLEAAGVTGPAGPIGPPGPVGASGASGAAGASGGSGADGRPGVAGSNGTPGAAGSAGASGAGGAPGAAGSAGPGGVDGVDGVPGAAGATGGAGPAGVQGEAGPAGAAGVPGAPGADGRSIVDVTCSGVGATSSWRVSYSDGSTSEVPGPCRLEAGPSGEPTTTPPIDPPPVDPAPIDPGTDPGPAQP